VLRLSILVWWIIAGIAINGANSNLDS
jgi:hypothetical protein